MALRSVLELILRTRKQGNAPSEVEKDLGRFKKGLKDAAKTAAAVTASFVATGFAIKKAFDLAEAGAELARLEQAGRNLADQFGQDMDEIARSIQRASDGTISRMDAIAAANRALQLGVAETPEEFEELTRAAVALGRAMGRGPVEAIDDISTGIGRMSPLILDNLGILTRGGAVFDDYAASLGKSTDELTDAERKQALFNQAVQDGSKLLDRHGNLIDDTATAYDRLAKEAADSADALKKELGETLAPVAEETANVLRHTRLFQQALEESGAVYQQVGDQFRFISRSGEDLGFTQEELVANWFRLKEETLSGAEALIEAGHATDGWRAAMERAGGATEDLAQRVPTLEEQFASTREEFERSRQASDALWDSLDTGILNTINRFQEQIDFLQAGGQNVVAAFQEVQSAVQAGLITPEEAETALRDIELAAIAVAEETGQIDMNEAISQVRDEFNVSWEEAKGLISDAKGIIDAIPAVTEKRIEFFIEYTGAPLPGFQHGGQFTVRGQPGPDRVPVAFMATAGETVTVTPRGGTAPQTVQNAFEGATINIATEVEGQALVEEMKRVFRRS